MNALPIVHRELRVTSRKPWMYWSRSLVALVGMVGALLAFYEDARRGIVTGEDMLWALSVITLILVLFYGCLLTADCISSEKREDTLGLLFLTNLRGYDVVAGKISTHAFTTATWLLAAFPVFFLPILAGGVTWVETLRVLLAITVSFLFALCLGVWVSTRSRDARNAVMTTLTLLAVIVLLPLLLVAIFEELLNVRTTPQGIARLSPVMLLFYARDASYMGASGIEVYWTSLATFMVGSAILIGSASRALPEVWRQHGGEGASGKSFPGRFRFKLPVRFRLGRRPRRFLSANPFQDFFLHRFTHAWWAKVPLALLMLLFAILLLSSFAPRTDEAYFFAFLIVLGMHAMAKFVFAFDATRALNEDRRNSALELLSITLLGERALAEGQALAFRTRFKPAVRRLFLLTLILQVVAIINSELPFRRADDHILISSFLWGPMIWTWSDYRTIAWLGMLQALRQSTHLRATLFALGQSALFPWALYFPVIFMMAEGGADETAAAFVTFLWAFGSALYAKFRARRRRTELLRDFQKLAAGEKTERARWPRPVRKLKGKIRPFFKLPNFIGEERPGR